MLRANATGVAGMLVAEYGALVRYSRRLTANGPEAVDLVQMLCARVLAQGAASNPPANASAWLRTALFRLFVDFRRRARREIPSDVVFLEAPAVIVETEPSAPVATVEDVRAALALLPAHYRVPFELYTFEQLSYEGIAARLGIPCRTIGTRINRARKQLRGLLEAPPNP